MRKSEGGEALIEAFRVQQLEGMGGNASGSGLVCRSTALSGSTIASQTATREPVIAA